MTRILTFVVFLLVFVVPNMAYSHSTAGLVKTTLKAKELTIDNVAYYIEQKVGKRMDPDGRAARYFVWDFDKIEQNADLAKVYMQVYDQKTGEKTGEVMFLKRGNGNTWDNVDKDGNVIQAKIYHYVKPVNKARYIVSGIIVVVALISVFVIRKRIAKKRGVS